jgi:hypothetical protein
MKNILNQSDSNQDLKIIEKIKVTDYKYIDKIIKGSKIHKKLIAQELEKVFPQAVSKSTDFVPSIYAKSYSTFFDEPKKKLRIILDKFHKLGIGDTIRIYVLENNLQKEIRKTVTEINDDYTFTINSEKNYKNIFVWGKQVNDFRTIDYEAVSMLHLSATQELIKRLNYTENENQILKRRLEKLENLIKKILEK